MTRIALEYIGMILIFSVANLPYTNIMEGVTWWWFIRILLLSVGIGLIQYANGKKL